MGTVGNGRFGHAESFVNVCSRQATLFPVRAGQPNVFARDQEGMPVLDDRQFYTLINLWFMDKMAVQAEGEEERYLLSIQCVLGIVMLESAQLKGAGGELLVVEMVIQTFSYTRTGMQMLRDALLWKAQHVVQQALQRQGATNTTWSIIDPGT